MSKRPLYREIIHSIRQKIQAGELRPGDALPTETLLQQQYGVSRVTVRQALKMLSEQGEIESIQGSGSYVKAPPVNYDIYQLTSFNEKLVDREVDTHSDVINFEVQLPSLSLATSLKIAPEDKVYYVKRVRFIKQKPVILEETWMPVALFSDLTYEVMQQSKYHYIETLKKMVIDRSEQEIVPVIPSADVMKALGIDGTQPILEKRSVGYLDNGKVFEVSRNFFKTEEYKFTLVAKRQR